ncbi:uncharacterized protein LOC142238780 [Haematobia irritans]|uniref:uncharacterized protein LOC142238780 n=1 Tax=Haematobia irritans TaxID=7368 RepID=UPI003F4F3FCF
MDRRNSKFNQCLVCKKYHSLRYCRKFLNMSITDRRRAVVRHEYCVNCLARSHKTIQCNSPDVCQRCGKEHHTLLHEPLQRRIYPRTRRSNPVRRSNRQRQVGRPKARIPESERSNPMETTRRPEVKANISSENPQRCLEVALRALSQLQRFL